MIAFTFIYLLDNTVLVHRTVYDNFISSAQLFWNQFILSFVSHHIISLSLFQLPVVRGVQQMDDMYQYDSQQPANSPPSKLLINS